MARKPPTLARERLSSYIIIPTPKKDLCYRKLLKVSITGPVRPRLDAGPPGPHNSSGTEIRTRSDRLILFPTGRNQRETAAKTGGHKYIQSRERPHDQRSAGPIRAGDQRRPPGPGNKVLSNRARPQGAEKVTQFSVYFLKTIKTGADRSLFLPADIDQDQEGPAPDQISRSRPGGQALTSYRQIQTRTSRNRPNI